MIGHNLKTAINAFLRFRLHTFINVISLSFGFMCFIAAFVISVYFNSFDQHFPYSDRIFIVKRSFHTENGPLMDEFPITSRPLASHLKNEFPELDYVVRSSIPTSFEVSTAADIQPHNIRFVDPEYLELFPIPILKGIPAGTALQPNTVLITHEAALKRFGTTDVIGKRLLIAHQAEVTIAGVTEKINQPSHLQSVLPQLSTDIIAPLKIFDRVGPGGLISEQDPENWFGFQYVTYIRFSPSVVINIDDFEKRLFTFANRVIPSQEDVKTTSFYTLQPLASFIPSMLASITGGIDITKVLIFVGALVLLIAGLNSSNLVVAQLVRRGQEIGVQKIMGARRRQLLFQYSFEVLLLGFVALLIALLCLSTLLMFLVAGGAPGIQIKLLFSPDLWIALGAVITGIVLVAGTYPAIRVSRENLVDMLYSQGTKTNTHRLRSLIVGTQFVISSALLILVIIILNQNRAMIMQASNAVDDPTVVYTDFSVASNIDPQIITTELAKESSIKAVSWIGEVPWSLYFDGVLLSREPAGQAPAIQFMKNTVSYDFSTTLELPLLAGRSFSRDYANDVFPDSDQPDELQGPFAIVLDEVAVTKLGFNSPGEALDQTVYRLLSPPEVPTDIYVPLTVIGVVGHESLKLIDIGYNENAYLLQPSQATHLVVRIDKHRVAEALQHLEAVWKVLMPRHPLRPQFTEDLFQQSYQIFATLVSVITTLTTFAFLISCVGLLGVATFAVNGRQREVGIRKVMGASSWRVLRMLLLDFSKPVIVANITAWPMGFVIAKAYVSIFSYQTAITPLPFVVSFMIAISVACLVVGNQALNSARIRPASVLKYE